MKKVVVIGGGTGNFTVLSGLKHHRVDLSSIVTMADDGGSTGILRDELGVLPPGDVRQCLVALSDSSRLMRSLMNYRFENGGLGGHSFGNILLSALEKVTGSFEKAVEETGRILSIQGKVIPVTTHQVRLKMLLEDKKLLESQIAIFKSEKIHNGYSSLYLEPHPTANPKAIDEIMAADLVVLGPGDLYSSLIPNLLVEGISKALRETKAKKVFVINLMNKKGQTTGFAASNYLKEITRFTGVDVFDYVVVNTKQPEPELLQKYAPQHELVENDLGEDERVVACELLGKPIKHNKKDALAARRSLIRHDPKKLAEELMKLTERY